MKGTSCLSCALSFLCISRVISAEIYTELYWSYTTNTGTSVLRRTLSLVVVVVDVVFVYYLSVIIFHYECHGY